MNPLQHSLFNKHKLLIGMIHLPPLPGSPMYSGQNIDQIIQYAQEDLAALLEGGIQTIIIENFGDTPFCRHKIPRQTLVAMAIVAREVIQSGGQELKTVGINVLRNDWESAISIAAAVRAKFIRLNVLTGVYVTDQGLIQGNAFECLNFRNRVAPNVKIFADVFVKHASPLAVNQDTVLEDTVRDTVYRGQADAIIVSGTRTGSEPKKNYIKRFCQAIPGTPVLIGSGLTIQNAQELLKLPVGAIVGTSLKTEERIDIKKVRDLVNIVENL
ncbi:MAG: BtpA/SgcQ family protein [Candidatus Hodarchaeota archaeon]